MKARQIIMPENMFNQVLGYLSAMAQAKVLQQQGIITHREYMHLDTILCEKYGLSLYSIFRETS